jgi:hypothetical protein
MIVNHNSEGIGSGMNNKTIIALSKAVGKRQIDAARPSLTVGTHEVDFTVRVRGSLTVSEDTDKVPTVSIPMKETLALFIAYSGITGPHAANLLRRAMTDALAVKEDGEQNHRGVGAIREALPKIEEIERDVVAPLLLTLPRTPVNGMVRANLDVTEIGSLVTA